MSKQDSGGDNASQTFRFENWQKDDLNSAQEALEAALAPYSLSLSRELLNNASDSIVIAGRQGKGIIILTVSLTDELYVSVEDDGTGIHAEVEPYLFQWIPRTPVPEHLLKYHMEGQGSTIVGKMGDGLRQLKDFVEELDGEIGYRNKGQDRGAVFWFKVPVAKL